VLILIAWPAVARAGIIASSTFDSNPDGWLVKDLTFPAVGSPPTVLGTFTPTFNATGGNPGGHLSMSDPSANVWYWYAPSQFLGNQSAAYGGALQFDLAVTGAGFGSPPGFDQEDVVLVGGGLTLVYDTGFSPTPTSSVSWNSFSVGLTEAGWRRDSLTGPAATQADMQAVLGSLSALYIRGEFLFGLDDVGRLDNVVLSSPAAVPEPSSLTLFGLGGLSLVVVRFRQWRRRGGAVRAEPGAAADGGGL
jgi:hypothetical protein